MNNPFFHYVDDFDKEAEAFLKKYECEDAIKIPRRIPIRDIARRLMSLDIVQTEYLSADDSVQGAIAFSKGIVEVYDWSSHENTGYQVLEPTIFIDADIINEGRINNTLAHECYHWWRHRYYFNYQRIHEKSAEFGIRCNKNAIKVRNDGSAWTDVEKMEWQARTIAPKILMPRIATKKKIDELFKICSGKTKDRAVLTETVISELARFFAVSKQSAAIRMTELGYDEAATYLRSGKLDDAPQKQKIHKGSAATHNQIPVTPIKAFKIYCENEALRDAIDTGAFCFADGYFALRKPKYVQQSGNTFSLTEYAKAHLAECTLDFSTRLVADEYLIHDASSYMMYRSDTDFREETSFDANTQNTELYNKAKDFERTFQTSNVVHSTANEQLWKYMQAQKWNSTIFVYRTNLDPMTYTRVQDPHHKFKLPTLVAIGIGLKLDLSSMEEVLKLAGLSFRVDDRNQQAYKYLFTAFYGRSIDECNDFLRSINVPILGTKERA